MWGPKHNLGPIGSAVLTFIGYKQTERQAKLIYRLLLLFLTRFGTKWEYASTVFSNSGCSVTSLRKII